MMLSIIWFTLFGWASYLAYLKIPENQQALAQYIFFIVCLFISYILNIDEKLTTIKDKIDKIKHSQTDKK